MQGYIVVLSFYWPVLLPTGVLLGFVTAKAALRRRLLLWFVPLLILTAIIFVLVTGGGASTPRFAPVQLGVGIIAVAPAFLCAFIAAVLVLWLHAPLWLLWAAPATACLLSAPLVGFATLSAVCILTGDCL